MLDIYLISTIINLTWQIFSILFVLYKFTSFFTIIIRFLNGIINSMSYFKNYITNRYEEQENIITRPKSFFESIKSKFYKFFGISFSPIIPLYETNYSQSQFHDVFSSDKRPFYNDVNETIYQSVIESDSESDVDSHSAWRGRLILENIFNHV